MRKKYDLQLFAGEPQPNIITTQQITVNPREVDFVTSFGSNLTALTDVLGIAQPIRKANGSTLVSKKATGILESGDVPEGGEIPFSQFRVEPVSYAKINIKKYAKAVTIEAIAEDGAETSVGMTDDEFRQQLIYEVVNPMYNALLGGQLTSEESTWQMAIAMAIGRVKDRFKKMHKTATGVAVFVNTLDLYSYLGGAQVTMQTVFGMDYIKNFLGADIVFISSEIPQGRVVATPINNMKIYYVDPGDNEFTQAGLSYTTDPEVPYIGFHTEGNYHRAQNESFALMGITIFFEYIDAVAVITVSDSTTLKTLTVTPSQGSTEGTTKATLSGQVGTEGNVLKFKLSADKAVPVVYGENVRNWPVFKESTDISAETGQYITVVEADKWFMAVAAGSNTVVVNGD